MLNGFRSHVSNAPDKLSRTPQFSLRRKLWHVPPHDPARNSLKQGYCLAWRHRRTQLNKNVHVLWKHTQSMNLYAPLARCKAQRGHANLPTKITTKPLVTILRRPLQMIQVLRNTMRIMV